MAFLKDTLFQLSGVRIQERTLLHLNPGTASLKPRIKLDYLSQASQQSRICQFILRKLKLKETDSRPGWSALRWKWTHYGPFGTPGNYTPQGHSTTSRQTWIPTTPLWKTSIIEKVSVTETSWFQKKKTFLQYSIRTSTNFKCVRTQAFIMTLKWLNHGGTGLATKSGCKLSWQTCFVTVVSSGKGRQVWKRLWPSPLTLPTHNCHLIQVRFAYYM